MAEDNEILKEAGAAKAARHGADIEAEKRRARRWQVGKLGLGVGIGSAAVAAAVLFASRDRKKD